LLTPSSLSGPCPLFSLPPCLCSAPIVLFTSVYQYVHGFVNGGFSGYEILPSVLSAILKVIERKESIHVSENIDNMDEVRGNVGCFCGGYGCFNVFYRQVIGNYAFLLVIHLFRSGTTTSTITLTIVNINS
jgi:hypothetical protein